MKNTSRRNFIAGLATGAVALPIAASASTESTKHVPTWAEAKPVIKSMLTGYVKKWVYRDDLIMTDKYEIEFEIEHMLSQLKLDGMLHEYKVVAKIEHGRLQLKIGFKTEPNDKYKIWTMQVFSNMDKWKDNV